MRNPQIASTLRKIRIHVEAELAAHGTKVSAVKAELAALDATIELLESEVSGELVEFVSPATVKGRLHTSP